VIPDTQVKPGVPLDHLDWIGQYIVDRQPDRVIHLGDHWDMPSLSSYDFGKKAMEGRRYVDDVDAGNEGMERLTAPYRASLRRSGRVTRRTPLRAAAMTWDLLRGNHEDRIRRAAEDNAQMDGAVSFDHLLSPGWTVHDFLVPVFIDGIGYSHYWANPMSGRPLGGMMETRLKNIGHSFTAGHQQTLQTGMRFIHGPNGPVQHRGLVAGACYLHDEDYKGPQGNAHWRGIIVKHEVDGLGGYDLMEVSLDYLCRKYEGVALSTFLTKKYPGQSGSLWTPTPKEHK
jgi:hypothetical protein